MTSATSDSPEQLRIDLLAPESTPGIRVLPVVHERLEITALVRLALEELDPALVAVELPTTLYRAALQAVRRLPKISLIVSEEPEEKALVWVVAPGDPLVEALRWATERERPIRCIDPDLPYGGRHADPIPDPYAIWQIGAVRYLSLLTEHHQRAATDAADRHRESGMAFHLQQIREEIGEGLILALVGAAHVQRLRDRLSLPQPHPFARVERSHVEVRHLEPRSLSAILPDPPLAHAVWERIRDGHRPESVELETTLSRKVSVIRFGLRVFHGDKGESEVQRRERLVGYASGQGTARLAEGLLFPDRGALGKVVWKVGAGSYGEQTLASTAPWQRRMFFEFARRCARVQGQLVPGLYEWVVAARGVADDNLAWEVCEAGRTYPWQPESGEIPSARIDGSELDLGIRKVRFRRRFFRVKSRPVALPVRERPRSQDPEEWLSAFDTMGLCSYPPEDVVVEDYGRFLQHQAISILSAERKHSEPFSTSMLDGIDIRETLRRLQEGRVWVEERGKVPGEAGSVVVIFDRDPGDAHFPFRMTWLGEHDQESDMAFYATSPLEQVVGPGIMRATYGGFMLTQPRGRLFDVWTDRDYRFAQDKSEVLLMAGIDYSLEKIVVFVAPQPPAERLRRYGAVQGKQVMHIPLGALSPVTIRRIRVMHILAGRDKREVARDYIW